MANYLTVIHECGDFTAWKKAYDADAPTRQAAGLTEMHVLRDQGNANLVALMFGIGDMEKAQAFGSSPRLAAAMQAAGIVGVPRMFIRHGNYTRAFAVTYATMTLTVRDYATALKAYGMDAAERKAAGLTDLTVLQKNDDDNNLLILWSVADVAKAKSFFESPALAAHMAKSAGVVGPPELHFWHV